MNNPCILIGDHIIPVIPDKEHGWIMPTIDVALGYMVSESNIRETKRANADELIEGKHWVVRISDTLGGRQKMVFWTQRGVVRLGFFIRSDRAKLFRDRAEDLIIREENKQVLPQSNAQAAINRTLKDCIETYQLLGYPSNQARLHGIEFASMKLETNIPQLMGVTLEHLRQKELSELPDNKIRTSIIDIISNAGGSLSKHEITRKTQQIKKTARDSILSSMVADGVIVKRLGQRPRHRGKNPTFYSLHRA